MLTMVSDAGTLLGDMRIPQLIEGLVRKYGSVNAAARVCGIPESTMHKLASGERGNPTLETLRLLARGSGLSLAELVTKLDKEGARTT